MNIFSLYIINFNINILIYNKNIFLYKIIIFNIPFTEINSYIFIIYLFN